MVLSGGFVEPTNGRLSEATNNYIRSNSMPRPISVIASEIRATWSKVNYGAVPYLEAMSALNTIDDTYGCDDAKSIVLYFLSNATTFRGPDAKRLKAELKALAGVK